MENLRKGLWWPDDKIAWNQSLCKVRYIDSFIIDLHAIDGDDTFVPRACWIRGFYVYKQLQTRFDKTAYFGIPKDMEMDGMMTDGTLCTTQYQFEREPNPDCKPMEKTFYLQVLQFICMYIICLLYYILYTILRYIILYYIRLG